MEKDKAKIVAYWITTIFGPASFVIGGVLLLKRDPQALTGLTHLGYPAYFATILGLWKLLGAITVVIPRFPLLKEWAYAGFVFDLTAASASHAFAGDSTGEIVSPIVFLALVAASWALRPNSRKLSHSTN
jgi:uncharacterized membrane protein YphA (DoxX/SURF4 family)